MVPCHHGIMASGLHLESPDFQFLGQLDDRVVTGAGKVTCRQVRSGEC